MQVQFLFKQVAETSRFRRRDANGHFERVISARFRNDGETLPTIFKAFVKDINRPLSQSPVVHSGARGHRQIVPEPFVIAAILWAVLLGAGGGALTDIGPWYRNLKKPQWQG